MCVPAPFGNVFKIDQLWEWMLGSFHFRERRETMPRVPVYMSTARPYKTPDTKSTQERRTLSKMTSHDPHSSTAFPHLYSYSSTQSSVRCRSLASPGGYEQFHSLAPTYRRQHRPRVHRRCTGIPRPSFHCHSSSYPRYDRHDRKLNSPGLSTPSPHIPSATQWHSGGLRSSSVSC